MSEPHQPEQRDQQDQRDQRHESAQPQRGPDAEAASAEAQAAGRTAGERAEHIAADAAQRAQQGEHGESGATGAGADADAVRERVRQLVVELLQQQELSLEELNEVSRQVLEGAAAGVREATPESQRTVLRSVIDGLADSYATAANATRLALEEANARGKTFAQEDLAQTMRELRTLNERFLRTVGRTLERAGGVVREEAGSLWEHAQRAGESIRPSVQSALGAAAQSPGKLAAEVASAGLEASRHTAGRLIQAVAGALQGAGDALAREKREKQK